MAADLLDSMQLDMDMVVDFADLVFCDECMAGIKRMTRGLVVDTSTIAMDVIKNVGPGGNFLAQPHTFQNFRKELWIPGLLERRNWDLWEQDGAKDIYTVSHERMLEMIKTTPENHLSTSIEKRIDTIVDPAQA